MTHLLNRLSLFMPILFGATMIVPVGCSGGSSADSTIDSGVPDVGSIVIKIGFDSGMPPSLPDTGVPGFDAGKSPGGPDAGMMPGSDSGKGDAGSGGGSDGGKSGDADAALVSPVPLNLGAACTAATDCMGGPDPACLPSADYWTGGYCSSTCTTNADCGTGECVPNLFTDSSGNPISVCLEACTTTATCRTGYFCDTNLGGGSCAPQDCRVAPSVCTSAEQCNQSTGGCTPTALTAGYPATFPAPPQVKNAGGTVLANPVLVPMFFDNDSDSGATIAQMTAFFQGIGQTNYWKALSEYGVGPTTKVVPVMLGVAAPTAVDDSTQGSQLQDMLTQYIENGTGGTPAPDGNTIYILNFPTTTTISQGGNSSGGASCTFGGYHNAMTYLGGTEVPYAVLPRCTGEVGFSTDLQAFTAAASHELVEGCTDPFPNTKPAWSQCDAAHIYFDEANDGSEIGDLCENDPEAFWIFSDFTFVVQRFWSNTSAVAGHDPCTPNYDGEVFFNSAPVLSTPATFKYRGGTYQVDASKGEIGTPATFSIDLYSDAATTAWTVSVVDYGCFLSNQTSNSLLDITLTGGTCMSVSNSAEPCITQSCTGSNGDTLSATATVVAKGNQNTNGQVTNSELFGLLSTQGSGTSEYQHLWWGVITN